MRHTHISCNESLRIQINNRVTFDESAGEHLRGMVEIVGWVLDEIHQQACGMSADILQWDFVAGELRFEHATDREYVVKADDADIFTNGEAALF